MKKLFMILATVFCSQFAYSQNLRFDALQPFGSVSDDFFVDVEPGSRLLRTRNWNTSSPNIAATGIHTGSGFFEGNVGIGTTDPAVHFSNSRALVVSGAGANLRGIIEVWGEAGGKSLFQSVNGNSYIGSLTKGTGPGNVYFTYGDGLTGIFMKGLDGSIGIGTNNPAEKLSVNGKIRAHEIKVETANWPDYVFDERYVPASLNEIEAFIKANKHLPGIPSAKDVEKEGVDLGDMNARLLKKIEDQTLYLIAQDKKLQEVIQRIEQLESKITYNDKQNDK